MNSLLREFISQNEICDLSKFRKKLELVIDECKEFNDNIEIITKKFNDFKKQAVGKYISSDSIKRLGHKEDSFQIKPFSSGIDYSFVYVKDMYFNISNFSVVVHTITHMNDYINSTIWNFKDCDLSKITYINVDEINIKNAPEFLKGNCNMKKQREFYYSCFCKNNEFIEKVKQFLLDNNFNKTYDRENGMGSEIYNLSVSYQLDISVNTTLKKISMHFTSSQVTFDLDSIEQLEQIIKTMFIIKNSSI